MVIDEFTRDSAKATSIKTWPKLTTAAMDQVTPPNLLLIIGHKDHYKNAFLEFLPVLKVTKKLKL